MRRFEMNEGTSSKFWEVEVKGSTLRVRFGRLGTEGQTKEKKLASSAAAAQEAEKLVREKTGKGYVEKTAGAAPAPAKAAPAPKATTPARAPAPTGKFAFTAELDALFAKGWPQLRQLSDEEVPPAKAKKEALAALQAVDPYLSTTVPRTIAARMLRGYVHRPFHEQDAVKKAVESEGPIDAAYLQEILEKKMRHLVGETYEFRLHEVIFLFEAFLGTETVAEALADHLRVGLENPKIWGSKFDRDHQNANFRRVIPALGWLRLRLDPAKWKKLVAPLAQPNKSLPDYSGELLWLANDKAPLGDDYRALVYAKVRRDPKPLRAHFLKWPGHYLDDAQLFYVGGADLMLDAVVDGLPRQPKWKQLRIIDEVGTIRAPGTVRIVAGLLPSRSAGAAAKAWIERHAAWIESEALPALEKREEDRELVAAVRGALGGAAPPAPKSRKALEKELAGMFQTIEADLTAQKGKQAGEREVLRRLHHRYCETRAALDDYIPEAYFTHHLADVKWKADEETISRWMDLAVEVAGT